VYADTWLCENWDGEAQVGKQAGMWEKGGVGGREGKVISKRPVNPFS
jgi:hypothetical protein